MSEICPWWTSSWYLGPSKFKKMIKEIKKSYKKVENIKKESELSHDLEVSEAEKSLEKELNNLN